MFGGFLILALRIFREILELNEPKTSESEPVTTSFSFESYQPVVNNENAKPCQVNQYSFFHYINCFPVALWYHRSASTRYFPLTVNK